MSSDEHMDVLLLTASAAALPYSPTKSVSFWYLDNLNRQVQGSVSMGEH